MRIPSHRGAAVCIGGAAAAMAVCGGILNYGAAKIMSPGEAATTLAWAAAFSEAIKLAWLAGFRVCLHRRELVAAATLLGVGVLPHGYTGIAVLAPRPSRATTWQASGKPRSTPMSGLRH